MNNKSFTLIEVIIAIFLLTTGIFGAYTVIQKTLINASVSASKLTATYLSQEGIEIVRNIRDTNWLEQRTDPTIPWDDGLGEGDWEADYNSQILSSCPSPCDYNNLNFLNIDANGFYSYSAGTPIKFKRKITITPNGANILEVLVEVSWYQRTVFQSISVQENLYNWR
jgi:hypothetical protein